MSHPHLMLQEIYKLVEGHTGLPWDCGGMSFPSKGRWVKGKVDKGLGQMVHNPTGLTRKHSEETFQI